MFRNLPSPYRRLNHSYRRSLAVEALERRDMLTAGPRVIGVEVASTSWTPEFIGNFRNLEHPDRKGYDIPLGSVAQSATLTWTNIDQIRIRFNTDVMLNSADLSITGVNQTQYAFSAFRYEPETRWAMWTLATPIQSDRLHLDLDGNGIHPVRNFGGNALDGEWTNNSSTVSGNGTAGGDFEFKFNVQPADVNNSTNVTSADYDAVHQLNGESTASPGYNVKFDIDGSGTIDSSDEQAVVDRYFETLPAGTPAGVNNDAPTTTTFGLYHADDASPDLSIALAYGFADAENGSNGLTYSIASNNNSTLFGAASINQTTQRLTLGAVSGAVGRATITIRATDAGGLYVDTPVTVDVNRVNLPPEITAFASHNFGDAGRLYYGTVSDPDDVITEIVIYIDGELFSARCGVDENGEFAFGIIIDEDVFGYEYATAYDAWGLASSICEDWGGNT